MSARWEAISVLNGDATVNEAGKRSVGTIVQAVAAAGITA